MSDTADLRATLNKTDMSTPTIQASSRAMMRFYDKPGGANMAVSEWRSVLQTSSLAQSLPLLYVANEVLQSSKRNRGIGFLEAFSPVLGSSCQFICGRDSIVVEKVRRVVKIFGDRRVFSVRYVMDLLAGLETFRAGAKAATSAPKPKAVAIATKVKSPTATVVTTSTSDNDDDLFGGASDGEKLLDVSVDATALSATAQTKSGPSEFGSGAKRRRSSANTSTLSTAATGPVSKKPKALSAQNFLDLFQSVINLDEKYKSSIKVIESIPPSYLTDGSADVDDLVGDELTEMYKKACQTQRSVRRERRTMYSVAVQRRELEKEAKRYVSWLKNLLLLDDDDIEFCEKLEKKLDIASVCHEEAKTLRDERLAEEKKRRAEAHAMAQQKAEEEERRRILDNAKMEAQAPPGMVWNKESREYEYIHNPTEDSWRN